MNTSVALTGMCLVLAGCATGAKRDTLPSDGPTMAEIYREHMAGLRQPSPPVEALRHLQRGAADNAPHSTQAKRTADIDHRFARLPNPDLVMYVTPHLSPNGRYPVPGYSTVFPMYETVEYAMPGETSADAGGAP